MGEGKVVIRSTSAEASEDGRVQLTEVEAKELVKQAGIPVVETVLARSKSEAEALARRLGFPVALKVVSPDIVHKSDVGGVKLNLRSGRQVRLPYQGILTSGRDKRPYVEVLGVSVQKMARPGVEGI